MEARTPFWPLFRRGLGIGWLEPAQLVAGLGCFLGFWFSLNLVPLLVLLNGGPSFRGNLEVFFASVFPLLAFFWFLFVVLLSSLVSDSIWNVVGSEFLFTRAIDRRRLFRARAAALFMLITLPLFLNLLVAPQLRELTVDVNTSFGAALAQHEDHSQIVGDRDGDVALADSSMPGGGHTDAIIRDSQSVARNGAEMLAAWLLWWGVLGFFAAQGYCALIVRHFQGSDWRSVVLPYLPILLLLVWPFIHPKSTAGLFGESFLLFWRHPVLMAVALVPLALAMGSFCERRFGKLEIL